MPNDDMSQISIKRGRVAVRDLAYEALREACIRRQLEPGQVVTEGELASQLNVSRTPLREAIQRLQADGLIERAGNGRIHVRELRYDEAMHLYAVRTSLEQLAVEEAVGRATPENLARLRQYLQRMERAAESDEEDVADIGRDFHKLIWKMAGNPVNERLLGNLDVLIDRYRYLSTGKTHTRRHSSVREHEEILDAIAQGDPAAAKEKMRQHLEQSRQSVLRALSSDEAVVDPTNERVRHERTLG